MKIQVSTDYAVRILQYLHQSEDELHTASSIAEAIGITYPFFIKIANQLKKRKLIDSVQGRNGGYFLGRPAEEISLYDVFLSIEGELVISRCLGDGPCMGDRHKDCRLHDVFRNVQEKVIEELSGQTIAKLAS